MSSPIFKNIRQYGVFAGDSGAFPSPGLGIQFREESGNKASLQSRYEAGAS